MRIRIVNFQSIKELDVESDGLILCCGPSNTGKTSIHRALRYMLVGGKIDFTRLLRKGSSHCEIHLWFGEHYIAMRRSKRENTLWINGKEFTKIGMTRPPELASIGFKPIEANKHQIYPQIASQHGSLFLVGEDSDAVTRAEAMASISAQHMKGVVSASRAGAAEEKHANLRARLSSEEKERVEKRLELVSDWNQTETLAISATSRVETHIQNLSRLERLRKLRGKRDNLLRQSEAVVQISDDSATVSEEKVKRLRSLLKVQVERVLLTKQLAKKISREPPKAPNPDKLQVLNGLRRRRSKLEPQLKVGVSIEVPSTRGLEDLLKRSSLISNASAVQVRIEQGESDLAEAMDQVVEADEAWLSLKQEVKLCPVCGKGLE